MPIPDPAFHIIPTSETGMDPGIAFRRDPAAPSSLLGIELCPDCAWDCEPVITPACGSGTCTGLNRPPSVTLVLTGAWTIGTDCRGCSEGTPTTCGEQNPSLWCECDCVPPGTYILPYIGLDTSTSPNGCIYGFDIDYPTYPNPCDNERSLLFRVYLAGVGNNMRLTITPGSASDRTEFNAAIPDKECLDFDLSFVSSDQDGYGVSDSCETGTVRVYV